jgi:hypothetical protein
MLNNVESLANSSVSIITVIRTPKRSVHAIDSPMAALRLRQPNTAAEGNSKSRFLVICFQGNTGGSEMISHRDLGCGVADS